MALVYVIGIPLSFPTSLVVFFGSYAASHVYGFNSNILSSMTFIEGIAFFFFFNMVFGHIAHFNAFLLGRYLLRGFVM